MANTGTSADLYVTLSAVAPTALRDLLAVTMGEDPVAYAVRVRAEARERGERTPSWKQIARDVTRAGKRHCSDENLRRWADNDGLDVKVL